MKLDLVKIEREFEIIVSECSDVALIKTGAAAFKAVAVIKKLENILTDEVMKAVFMPLMNKKIGFLTDRNGKPDWKGNTKAPYSVNEVRTCLIDALNYGLLPTYNEFNIIAGNMYPTKEGFTARLRAIGCKYILNTKEETKNSENTVLIPIKIDADYNKEKISFTANIIVKTHKASNYDQNKGKAERKAKKILFEYCTGLDLGDSDIESDTVVKKRDNKEPITKQVEAEDVAFTENGTATLTFGD